MSALGPELPPNLLAKRKRQAEEQEEVFRSEPGTSSPESGEKKRRVVGPAPPPAPLEEKPVEGGGDTDDSSDDDDYGPALPSARETTSQSEEGTRHKPGPDPVDSNNASKPQREEWMLLPPKEGDWTSRVDPTKIRNRKFNTGKGARAPPQKSGGDMALWTETPEQKRQRLADEVLGVKGPATQETANHSSKREDERAAEAARRIQEYNDRNRGRSLYEEHRKGTPTVEEDDPSKRAFDKEKDIRAGQKIGHAQRREMVNRAAGFGSRFSGGSYL